MADAVVNGVRLAYQQMGEGPDVVLIHGLAASRAFWFGAYALPLMHRYRVTLFDLRGHGYSEVRDSGYSTTAMVADVLALLDALQIQRSHLVGHSYGGGIALDLASAHRSRVQSLCVMDAKVNALQPYQRLHDTPYLSPFELEVHRRTGVDWEAENQVGLRFLEAVAEMRLRNEAPSSRDAIMPFGEGRGATRAAKSWLELIGKPGVRDEVLSSGASSEQLHDGLRGLPTLLMYGETSRCLTSCNRLAELIPQAQVEVIADGGHFFPLSHTRLVLPTLEKFLHVSSSDSGSDGPPLL